MVYLYQKLVWPPFTLFAKFFLKLKVRGQKNFKKIKKKQYFIVSNHLGYLDAFLVCAAVPFFHFLKTDFRYMVSPKWYETYPIVKYFGAYPLYRKQETLEKTLESTEEYIGKGKNMLIFPEGGFPKFGIRQKPKKGIGYLAKKYNFPILPVAIKGSDSVNGQNGLSVKNLFSGKHNIEINIGEPFFYADVADENMDYQTVADKIMDRVNIML